MNQNELYDKECEGRLIKEECFDIYFPCDDFDCKFYGECKQQWEDTR